MKKLGDILQKLSKNVRRFLTLPSFSGKGFEIDIQSSIYVSLSFVMSSFLVFYYK
jgi:hypothetical protein